MKTRNIFSAIFMATLLLFSTVAMNSCKQQEELDTNQFVGSEVTLLGYGPSPVARGGQLRFIGVGLDQIISVKLAGQDPISKIEVISSEEIRITVPQTAQPCYPSLYTKDGKGIDCKVRLTFTEPVGFAANESLTPNPIKPGQALTIKGDYLNLVQKIVFADKVEVTKFNSQSREEIVLVVPAEAKSGKVTLSFCATEDTIPNEILSEEKLEVVIPSVDEIAKLDDAKPGTKVTVKGHNFDLITAVKSPTNDSIAFVATEDQVEFTMPENITNGGISVLTASGVNVVIATVGVALPEEVVLNPATGLRADNIISITGKNLELVTGVTFTKGSGTIDAAVEEGGTATEIKVKFPAEATTGNIVLHTAANIDITLPYETLKPGVGGFDQVVVPLGDDLTIRGSDLDLVVTATYTGGATVDVEVVTNTQLRVPMPTSGVADGPLTLTMANGETVTTGEITISAPAFCFVVEWPGEDVELKAGQLVTLGIENADKLTGVQIDGKDCQYIVIEDKLYVGVPQAAGKNSKIKLISSNGDIEYDLSVTPATEVTTVLWEGIAVADDWANQPYLLSDAGVELLAAGAAVGDIIDFYITPTDASWKLEIVEGHWGATYKSICAVGADTEGGKFTEYDLAANGGKYSLEITQEMLDAAYVQQWWGGTFVANGDNVIINKITMVHHVSLEMTIWEGEAVADDWGNQPYVLSDAGQEFIDFGVKAGQLLRFYITPLEDPWKLEIVEGHWGPTYCSFCSVGADTEGGKFTEYDLAAHGGAIELTVTQAMIDAALVQQWWGGIFVLNGDNVKCTKITVE